MKRDFHAVYRRKEKQAGWRVSRTVWVRTDPADELAVKVLGAWRAASLWQVRRRMAQVLFPIRSFAWVPISDLRFNRPKGA